MSRRVGSLLRDAARVVRDVLGHWRVNGVRWPLVVVVVAVVLVVVWWR